VERKIHQIHILFKHHLPSVTSSFNTIIPQGLGTGGLYETNFETRLVIENGALFRRK
jgi:hypothetical protein